MKIAALMNCNAAVIIELSGAGYCHCKGTVYPVLSAHKGMVVSFTCTGAITNIIEMNNVHCILSFENKVMNLCVWSQKGKRLGSSVSVNIHVGQHYF